jgi:hypothetical protein
VLMVIFCVLIAALASILGAFLRHSTSKPTKVSTQEPTTTPTTEQTYYCGCPQCTQAVWDSLACDDRLGGCHTCGGRISCVESNNGGNTYEACKLVSNQFDQGPCGPVCNPDTCNGYPMAHLLGEPD